MTGTRAALLDAVCLLAAGLGLVACFAPKLDEAQFSCRQGRCPDGYICSEAPAFACVTSLAVPLDLGAGPADGVGDAAVDRSTDHDGPVVPVDQVDAPSPDRSDVRPDAAADMSPDAPGGEVFTVTEGPNASLTMVTTDTHIDEAGPDAPHGDDGVLEVNGVEGQRQSAFIRWDLSTLQGRRVMSAQLRVYVLIARDRLHLHEVLAPWDNSATFNEAMTGTPWPSPGCEQGCWADTPFTTIEFLDADAFSTVDLDASVVQGWIDQPAANFGMVMRLDIADGAGQARLLSSDHLTYPDRRPALVLVLEPAS
jgi:hypothetical protein